MKNSETFNNLIDNAFDFLDKALEEFEQQPKYAVINFYTALELFLKARLLHEDWTLILSNQEAANRGKFDKGEFHSVNLKEAQKRLEVVVQQGLDKDAKDCFENLLKHRNRMVHFFHDSQFENKEVESIVAEQCRAWYYLHPLLSKKWNAVFKKYQYKISAYNDRMLEHFNYLTTKFTQLGKVISDKKKEGKIFHGCPACGFDAVEENTTDHPILSFHCLVCDWKTTGAKIKCPKCGAPEELIGEPWVQCSCGYEFFYDNAERANCGECGTESSVVELTTGEWICLTCFTHFDKVYQCESCQACTTAPLAENSFWFGCGHCEGEIGRRKDD